jgi:hypothetical protein
MSERSKSLKRIVALQAQRKQLAAWRLQAGERRRAEVEAAQTALDGFVAQAELAGPLASVALKQARCLAERHAAVTQEQARLTLQMQAAERRHRLAERIADAVATEERAAAERHSLEQLLEATLARGVAGP